ncbi:hypothetical protein [Rhizobium sp. HT1-10]|uniref:hypothetical protein n=1 Tax=Rhizobium sp. HT1-10 TaxID=3111638 RepID=UPI003C1E661B
MPKFAARILAEDQTVETAHLEAAVDYLTEKLLAAAANNEPARFITYRNRLVLEHTLCLRHERKT